MKKATQNISNFILFMPARSIIVSILGHTEGSINISFILPSTLRTPLGCTSIVFFVSVPLSSLYPSYRNLCCFCYLIQCTCLRCATHFSQYHNAALVNYTFLSLGYLCKCVTCKYNIIHARLFVNTFFENFLSFLLIYFKLSYFCIQLIIFNLIFSYFQTIPPFCLLFCPLLVQFYLKKMKTGK